MPLTPLQARTLRTIACNRSPESYVAGATLLHRGETSPRFSRDVDVFHDVADSVAVCAEVDADTLQSVGYELTWILRTPSFYRAVLAADGEQLRIEWAQDSAFRFFPVVEDDECGYRLHEADVAVNKVLALAGRQEPRDYVDTLHLHRTYLHLGALVWAACGKDPGYTPTFLLEQAAQHVAYAQADVDRLSLREPLSVTSLKETWVGARDEAHRLVGSLPPEEVGCLYLDAAARPTSPDPSVPEFLQLTRHRGTVRGAWPTLGSRA